MSADHRSERDLLLAYVRAARNALSELGPNGLRTTHLPSAMNEIGMIVETTESAANQIMDVVDSILNLPEDTRADLYRSTVEEKCMALMEACSFQDLTGQRSTKIVTTLLNIEYKLGKLAHLLGEDEEAPEAPPPMNEDVLLNGPCMPGEGVDQDEIDRLFEVS